METKRCYLCQKDLPKDLDHFDANKARKDGLQARCKTCDREYKAQKYQENKEVYKQRAAANRKAKVEWYKQLKQSLRCSRCPETRWYVLEFHHEGDKELTICDMMKNGFGRKRILEEIEKCRVLCANCHKEVHHFERNPELE